jgi:pimeloyl-ACP methyl ester carboxylesterase
MNSTVSQILHHEVHLAGESGEWMLLIHGAGGSTATWKRQIPELRKHCNLVVVDLPGHGKMAGKISHDGAYSFELIGQRLWNLLDHLEVKQVHLTGVSLGTIIALTMIMQQPSRVRSLINAGAILRLNTGLKILASTSLSLAKIIGYPTFYKLSARIMMPRKNHKKSRDVFIRESRALSTEEFKKWTAMYFGLNNTLKKLFTFPLDIPHLVVMGNQDHLFLRQARKYARIHQKVKLEIVNQCGHVVSIEKAEIFNSLVIKHLKYFTSQNQANQYSRSGSELLI